MDSASRTDRELLATYARRGDPDAFAELARRTGGMVFATCRRVLGDAALAQDAAQETFLQLVRAPRQVTGPIGPWLHRVATTKALDLARREGRVRRREQAVAAADQAAQDADAPWSELSASVDEALADLDPGARSLLVRHYLEGATQEAIAREQECSQATVSRRLEEAIAALRARLRERGFAASALVLSDGLRAEGGMAMPPTLAHALGKMALAAPPAMGGALLLTLLCGAMAAAALAIAAVLVAAHSKPASTHPGPPPLVRTAASAAPAAVPQEPAMAAFDETSEQELLLRAVAAIDAGDADGLRRLLGAHPGLARARVASDQGRYCGYFHHATLLHHTACNPGPPSAHRNLVELATILLDAGAAVDARTDAGPAQPQDPGWTTLGLAASAGDQALGAQADGLIDLLIARGADVDDCEGLPMQGALYYGFERGWRALLRHGARLDLRAAANVGDAERVRSLLGLCHAQVAATRADPSGTPDLVVLTIGAGDAVQAGDQFVIAHGAEDACTVRAERVIGNLVDSRVVPGSWHAADRAIAPGDAADPLRAASPDRLTRPVSCLFRYGLGPAPASDAAWVTDGLFGACNGAGPGQMEIARLLIHAGADPRAIAPRAIAQGATPLHVAAWAGDLAVVHLLLAHGADPRALDAQYHATPAAWAAKHRHQACAALLREAEAAAAR